MSKRDLAEVFALILIAFGAGLIYFPAGLIALGVLAVLWLNFGGDHGAD